MQDFKKLEKLLKSIANRRRVAILAYIKKEKEATVGEISANIHLSFASTSKHLGVLFAANLIDRDQRGAEMYYSVTPPRHDIIHTLYRLL